MQGITCTEAEVFYEVLKIGRVISALKSLLVIKTYVKYVSTSTKSASVDFYMRASCLCLS
jgi:hypothetical protein